MTEHWPHEAKALLSEAAKRAWWGDSVQWSAMNLFNRPPAYGLRLVAAGLVLFCGLPGLTRAAAEQVKDLPAKPADYVNDFAHVLSPEAVAKLDQLCSQLDHSQANAQIAIVTVKTLDGDDPADWANQLENKWHMGKKAAAAPQAGGGSAAALEQKDKGVLMLLAVDDHKWRIDVGYGLEGILNDAKLGDIGRAMRPQLRAKDYDGAVLQAVTAVGNVIAQDAKITLDDWPTDATPPPPHYVVHRSHPLGGLILLIILLVVFGGSWIFRLLFGLALFSGPRGPFGGGGLGGGFGGFGGGGGGDSGGGGGGFGGFGGGDFGGGGAGGDW